MLHTSRLAHLTQYCSAPLLATQPPQCPVALECPKPAKSRQVNANIIMKVSKVIYYGNMCKYLVLCYCSRQLTSHYLKEPSHIGSSTLVPVHACHVSTCLDVSTSSVIGDPLIRRVWGICIWLHLWDANIQLLLGFFITLFHYLAHKIQHLRNIFSSFVMQFNNPCIMTWDICQRLIWKHNTWLHHAPLILLSFLLIRCAHLLTAASRGNCFSSNSCPLITSNCIIASR